MAEVNSAPDVEYNDDGSLNPDYVAPTDGSESVDIDTKNNDDQGNPADNSGDNDGDSGFDDSIDPDKPIEIPIRQSVAQHIIARKNDKIAKLKSKIDDDIDDTNDDEDDDDELSEVAQKAISKQVDKILSPLKEKLIVDADESEMKELFKSEPEAKKYENHIKAYMGHESYKGVSPAVIYHHLAWTTAQALGAKKKEAADLDANQHKSGGRTIPAPTQDLGGLPTAEDIDNMSESDFEQMQLDAIQGKYLKK